MIARSFKSVGWVAASGTAALSCYMVSLTVAAERAELESMERKIIAAKQEIRSLSTELGTRGRMAQLDRWNVEVLALAAPTSAQFLDNEFTLARFDMREKTVEERAKVQLASAETGVDAASDAPAPAPAAQRPRIIYAAGDSPLLQKPQPLVRQASLIV